MSIIWPISLVQAKAVLFDLDGTLIDTAGDLVGALNHVLQSQGKAAVPIADARPYISTGAAGLVHFGFGLPTDVPESLALHKQLVAFYRDNLSANSHLFEGMDEVLDTLDQQKITWGIVTNKITALTKPLLKAKGLLERSHCLVCRDTTPEAKPSPMPLLHACQVAGLTPEETLYVGDARSDMQAANAAHMVSVVASYGYIHEDEDLDTWQADAVISQALDVLPLLALGDN